MALHYNNFVLDVIVPLALIFSAFGTPIFIYALFLKNKDRQFYRFSPPITLGISLLFFTGATIIAVQKIEIPSSYAQSIRYLYLLRVSDTWFFFDQALILSTLIFKLCLCHLIASRLAQTALGLLAGFLALLLMGAAISAATTLTLDSWMVRQPLRVQEMLPYILDIGAYVLLAAVIVITDFTAYWARRIRVQGVERSSIFRYGTIFIVSLTLPLIGFLVLRWWAATLWLVFLIVASPVLLATAFVLSSGERFSSQLVVKMYREILLSILQLLRRSR